MHTVLVILGLIAAAVLGVGILAFIALVLPWIVSDGR
jgi:hypothetical protein